MNIRQRKQRVLLLFLGFAYAQGFAENFFQQGSNDYRIFSLLCIVFNAIITMRWYTLDAKEHNYKISKLMFKALVIDLLQKSRLRANE